MKWILAIPLILGSALLLRTGLELAWDGFRGGTVKADSRSLGVGVIFIVVGLGAGFDGFMVASL